MDWASVRQKDIDKFRSLYKEGGPDECWLWKGTCPHGNAEFTCGGRRRTAARFSYWLSRGEIPPAKFLVRKEGCSKLCINPKHLLLSNHPCESACLSESTIHELDAVCDEVALLQLRDVEAQIRTLERRLKVLTILRDGMKVQQTAAKRVTKAEKETPKPKPYKHPRKGTVRDTFQASTENRIVCILAAREDASMAVVDLQHALACGRQDIVEAVERSPLFDQEGELVSLNEAGRERAIVMETTGYARPHG